MFDLIIKKANIVTGKLEDEIFEGDIGIKKGKILKIGKLDKELSSKDINAQNHLVCPGFIDINNSADHNFSIFNCPFPENLIRQGVTTVILGNRGVSLAPLLKGSLSNFEKWVDSLTININWTTIKDLFKELEKRGLAINVGTLIGWGNIRSDFTEGEFRNLTKEELEKACYLVRKSLEEGALGVSFGLNYYHEKMVGIKEIEAVSRVVKEKGGYLSFCLRDPQRNFIKSIEEILEIAEITNLEVEINNFLNKVEELSVFNKGIEKISHFNENQELINFDLSPYDYQVEDIFEVLPEWVAIGRRENFIKNLTSSEFRKKILEELKGQKDLYLDAIVIDAGKKWWFTGCKLKDIAEKFNLSLEETILKITQLCNGQVSLIVKNTSEENVDRAVKNYYSFISSNSGFLNLETIDKKSWFHPKSFSNFIYFLKKYTKENQEISLKEAIFKLTFQVAQKIGLKDRGLIKEGYQADLVVLDLENLDEKNTFSNPLQYPLGIKSVIINGNLAYHKGVLASQKYGQIIKNSNTNIKEK